MVSSASRSGPDGVPAGLGVRQGSDDPERLCDPPGLNRPGSVQGDVAVVRDGDYDVALVTGRVVTRVGPTACSPLQATRRPRAAPCAGSFRFRARVMRPSPSRGPRRAVGFELWAGSLLPRASWFQRPMRRARWSRSPGPRCMPQTRSPTSPAHCLGAVGALRELSMDIGHTTMRGTVAVCPHRAS